MPAYWNEKLEQEARLNELRAHAERLGVQLSSPPPKKTVRLGTGVDYRVSSASPRSRRKQPTAGSPRPMTRTGAARTERRIKVEAAERLAAQIRGARRAEAERTEADRVAAELAAEADRLTQERLMAERAAAAAATKVEEAEAKMSALEKAAAKKKAAAEERQLAERAAAEALAAQEAAAEEAAQQAAAKQAAAERAAAERHSKQQAAATPAAESGGGFFSRLFGAPAAAPAVAEAAAAEAAVAEAASGAAISPVAPPSSPLAPSPTGSNSPENVADWQRRRGGRWGGDSGDSHTPRYYGGACGRDGGGGGCHLRACSGACGGDSCSARGASEQRRQHQLQSRRAELERAAPTDPRRALREAERRNARKTRLDEAERNAGLDSYGARRTAAAPGWQAARANTAGFGCNEGRFAAYWRAPGHKTVTSPVVGPGAYEHDPQGGGGSVAPTIRAASAASVNPFRYGETIPLRIATSVGHPEINDWWCDLAKPGCLRPMARATHGGDYEPGWFWYRENYAVCEACYRGGYAEDHHGYTLDDDEMRQYDIPTEVAEAGKFTPGWRKGDYHKVRGGRGVGARWERPRKPSPRLRRCSSCLWPTGWPSDVAAPSLTLRLALWRRLPTLSALGSSLGCLTQFLGFAGKQSKRDLRCQEAEHARLAIGQQQQRVREHGSSLAQRAAEQRQQAGFAEEQIRQRNTSQATRVKHDASYRRNEAACIREQRLHHAAASAAEVRGLVDVLAGEADEEPSLSAMRSSAGGSTASTAGAGRQRESTQDL